MCMAYVTAISFNFPPASTARGKLLQYFVVTKTELCFFTFNSGLEPLAIGYATCFYKSFDASDSDIKPVSLC